MYQVMNSALLRNILTVSRTVAPFVAAAALFTPLKLSAAPQHAAPLQGWTHEEALDRDSPAQHGVLLSGNDVTYSAPVIAEIDGDPSNGKEVAVGSSDGTVYAYRSSGDLLWERHTPVHGCQGAGNGNKLLSSPAVGELFGNGMPYVVIGYGGIANNNCDGGVIALRGSDGAAQWTFSLREFRKRQKFWAIWHTVFSTPALADVNGDGKLEVGFGSYDRNIYLLNSNGKPRWYYQAADTIWSSATFLNVNESGPLEMVIGSDISKNPHLRPPTSDGGFVYAFNTKARPKKKLRVNFRDSSHYQWSTFLDQVVYGAPVAAELLSDSPGKELIVGAGCYFPSGSSNKRGKWFKILNASSGAVLQTIPVEACSPSSPAVADLDYDGYPEVILTVSGDQTLGGSGNSRVIVWSPRLNREVWSVTPMGRGRNDSFGGQFISATVADMDGNGSLEVVVANGPTISLFAGLDGTPLTCQTRECDDIPGLLWATGGLRSTPAIGDINNDGVLDIVAAGGHEGSSHGALFAWTNLADAITSSPGTGAPYAAPWPMYRGDQYRAANYPLLNAPQAAERRGRRERRTSP